jgi:hypothetical protein
VTNTSDRAVKVLKWQLPSDELHGSLFRLTREDGSTARYVGPVVKRAAPSRADYAWIGLRRTATGVRLIQVANVDAHQSGCEREAASIVAPGQKIFLRVTVVSDAKCRFAYSHDGESFTAFGDEFQATVAKWVGAKVGLFASTAPGHPASGHADFDFFRVTP